ncbi:hypothetical protein GCM10025868_18040 [Angustibacter aerolatus]|uniref:Uncharacterized protein n=1 Tax=Angustibacter aerolatus TaxID=1162965 RepID=A0ABQ6JHG1_9ACTN|nr:hypothetical protein [Angustibacter aerolatus]GMA86554.1 hypothetical protein GCM10025868_18040 [Angustibacter aerolatus]
MSAVATAPAWALTPAVLSAPGWTVAVRRGRTGAVRVSTTPRHLLVDVADEAGTTWSTQALLDADGWVRVDAPASPPGVLGTDVGLRRLPDLPGSGDAVLAPGDVLLLLSADAIDALTAREGSRAWTDQARAGVATSPLRPGPRPRPAAGPRQPRLGRARRPHRRLTPRSTRPHHEEAEMPCSTSFLEEVEVQRRLARLAAAEADHDVVSAALARARLADLDDIVAASSDLAVAVG